MNTTILKAAALLLIGSFVAGWLAAPTMTTGDILCVMAVIAFGVGFNDLLDARYQARRP